MREQHSTRIADLVAFVHTANDAAAATACRDGTKMLLTPESSVLAQKQLGADIIIPLDELPPYHTEPAVLQASLSRSHRWMARR
jgi:queuine tRNA-ribosyltransferase